MKTRSRRLLLVVVPLLALAALSAALGLFEVAPGQVAVEPGSGSTPPRTWGSGRHWRLRGARGLLRLPTEAVGLTRDVELTTAEGAKVVLEVAGELAVGAGQEAAWLEAAGNEPFVEALGSYLTRRLEPEIRRLEPEALFSSEAVDRLERSTREALEAAGLSVAGLEVQVPAEKNPVAAAVVRNQLRRLAAPTGRKVLIVGWDGADWLMIRPLLGQGHLPNLARLMHRGVSAELRSSPPLLSPLIWTTLATGKPVVEHGIADFLVRDPVSGGLVPISSTARKVHALWTILSAFDLSTDVVAWWASWPAEPVRGAMITDRVAYQLFQVQEAEAGSKVYPPDAWSWVQEELVSAEEISYDEVRRFVDVSREDFDRRWQGLSSEQRLEDRVNHLRKILATTQSYHRIALKLLETQADLSMVYYEATDTVGHLFARFLPPRMSGVSEEEARQFQRALPEIYIYLDELLGQLLAQADDDTSVIVVSDHGFFTGEARPKTDPSDFTAGAPQWHRLYGVLVAAGPGIRPGGVKDATVFDLTPTVLTLLGLPVPEDMPGHPWAEVLGPGLKPVASGQLATYEVLPRQKGVEVRAGGDDQERLRELAALGYISAAAVKGQAGGPEAPAGGGGQEEPRGAAARAPDLEAVSTEAYNLGRIHQRNGDFAAAREQYQIALDRLPSFGVAYAALAQVAALEGRHSEAFEVLVRGFSNSRTMPMAALTGLVDEASECGRLGQAEDVLTGLRGLYGSTSAYHAALGLLQEKTGRADGALRSYRQALEIDPLDQLSIERAVTLLRQGGRVGEARNLLESAMGKAEGSLESLNQLAVVAMRQGWADQAERLFRRVLASDPGNPGVLANLATSQAQQGRMSEAVATMQEAVRRDPTEARNHFNLGAMLANLGRIEEAARAFQAAVDHGLRSPRVHVALSKMYVRQGRTDLGEIELAKALEIDPQDREARELLEILRSAP